MLFELSREQVELYKAHSAQYVRDCVEAGVEPEGADIRLSFNTIEQAWEATACVGSKYFDLGGVRYQDTHQVGEQRPYDEAVKKWGGNPFGSD